MTEYWRKCSDRLIGVDRGVEHVAVDDSNGESHSLLFDNRALKSHFSSVPFKLDRI